MNLQKESIKNRLNNLRIILRLWNRNKKLRLPFYAAMLIGDTNIIYGTFINSYAMQKITSVCISLSREELIASIINISLIFLGAMMIYPLSSGIVNIVSTKITGELKKQLFHQVESLPVSYIDHTYSGDIASRLTDDFRSAAELCGNAMLGYANPISLMITVVSICIIILYKSPVMGLISMVLNLISLLFLSHMRRPLQEKERRVKEATAEASQDIINSLSGAVVARMFGLDQYLAKKYETKSEEIYGQNCSIIHKKSVMFLLIDFQSFLSFVGITLIGLLLSVRGIVDIPTVVFISTMQMSLSQIISQIGVKAAELPKYLVAASRLYELLDTPAEQQRQNIAEPDRKCAAAIEMENVTFQYKSSNTPVFQQLNLRVGNGEKLAIVGGSGGGKSSLLKLLLEFEQKSSGDIYFYGNKIEAFSQRAIRSFCSYVPQNCYLFDTTIGENVRMGRPEASPEELEEALENAYLKEFISSLPEGINTQVGEHGSRLSGGQRQRVAIARAFLKNAPIILLDEATSALDSQSENEVQRALLRLMEGRTSIVIAHRLSTIQHADRIIVLEDGRLIEEGNHNALLARKGRYAQLYDLQYS